jgi:hypothetical protein
MIAIVAGAFAIGIACGVGIMVAIALAWNGGKKFQQDQDFPVQVIEVDSEALWDNPELARLLQGVAPIKRLQ